MFREEDVYVYGGDGNMLEEVRHWKQDLGDGNMLEEVRHWKQDLRAYGVPTLPFHSLIYDFI